MAPAAPEAEGLLTIAAVFPTIGRYAVSGQQSLRGARLAVEELNRAGASMAFTYVGERFGENVRELTQGRTGAPAAPVPTRRRRVR